MPKTFSDTERAYIKKRLMEEAQVCLSQYGMRKTTVDELVKRVNIPKGTFYLFYPSKELLFFEVFCTLHNELQITLLRWIDELKGNINADTVTELIFRLYKQVDSTFIYAFIASGDLELLVRKLLPGVHAEVNVKVFSAVLRAIFCTMLHRREIGEEVFDDAIRVMLRGVVLQLFEGETL